MRKSTAILFSLLLMSTLVIGAPWRSEGTEAVKFSFSWVPYGRDAGLFPAIEKGFFEAESLKVTTERGFGGVDNAKKVATGATDIGQLDTSSVVVSRAQGGPLRMVGIYHDRAPFGIRFLESSGIKTLKDLEGKTIGAPGGDVGRALLPALAELNGLDFSRLKLVHVDPAAREASLLAGAFQAATGFAMHEPTVQAAAKKQGKVVKYFLMSQYGVDIYGMGPTVTEAFAKAKPEVLRKFLRAAVRSVAYAIERPDEAVTMWIKYHPQGDFETNRAAWDLTIDFMITPEQERLGIFRMDHAKWVRTRDILSKGYKLTAVVPAEDLYTNDYLAEVKPPKRGPRVFPKLW